MFVVVPLSNFWRGACDMVALACIFTLWRVVEHDAHLTLPQHGSMAGKIFMAFWTNRHGIQQQLSVLVNFTEHFIWDFGFRALCGVYFIIYPLIRTKTKLF